MGYDIAFKTGEIFLLAQKAQNLLKLAVVQNGNKKLNLPSVGKMFVLKRVQLASKDSIHKLFELLRSLMASS